MKKLLILLIFLWASAAQAEIRKWVDAQGRVHYGAQPPAGGAAEAPMRGTVSVGDSTPVIPDVDSEKTPLPQAAVSAPRGVVWIYTTPRCGYCKRAMEHMRLKGVNFVEKDVTENPAYKREFKALGGRGVPVTLSGGKRISGYKEESYEAFLKSAGF